MLAMLDTRIQNVLHVAPAGVRKDGARPQSSRAGLHAPVKITHDQSLADGTANLRLPIRGGSFLQPELSRALGDRGAVLGPEIEVPHDIFSRLPVHRMI